MVVLDSDILVGVLRNNQDAIKFLEKTERTGNTLCITVISAFELFEGAILLDNKKRSEQTENLIKSFEHCFNFDGPASWRAAEISAGLKKGGDIISFEDLAIASICMARGQTLVTRNLKHFDRIKGLKTEKW